MTENSGGGDFLGLRGFGQAANTLAKGAVDGAAAFLSRICLPAAEEIGLALQDQVASWRMNNLVKILNRAEQKTIEQGIGEKAKVDPRLMFQLYENGTWSNDELLQEMWSGLLASSCSDGDLDDSNLIFINILSTLTTVEARILRLACEQAIDAGRLRGDHEGLIYVVGVVYVDLETLIQATGIRDLERLDREMDHLCSIGLIDGGFHPGSPATATTTPTALGLQLYARSSGSKKSVLDFFNITLPVHGVVEQTPPSP